MYSRNDFTAALKKRYNMVVVKKYIINFDDTV